MNNLGQDLYATGGAGNIVSGLGRGGNRDGRAISSLLEGDGCARVKGSNDRRIYIPPLVTGSFGGTLNGPPTSSPTRESSDKRGLSWKAAEVHNGKRTLYPHQ